MAKKTKAGKNKINGNNLSLRKAIEQAAFKFYKNIYGHNADAAIYHAKITLKKFREFFPLEEDLDSKGKEYRSSVIRSEFALAHHVSSLDDIGKVTFLELPEEPYFQRWSLEIFYALRDEDKKPVEKKNLDIYKRLLPIHFSPILARVFDFAATLNSIHRDRVSEEIAARVYSCKVSELPEIERNLAETALRLYRGLAEDFGFHQLYKDITTFGVSVLYPEEYRELNKILSRKEVKVFLHNVYSSFLKYYRSILVPKLKKKGISISLFYGRESKNIGSLLLKLKRMGLQMSEFLSIHDIVAFTIVVPSLHDVYKVADIMIKQIGKSNVIIDDKNKTNPPEKYQSLHLNFPFSKIARLNNEKNSTDFPDVLIEVHIRTEEQQKKYFEGEWAHQLLKSPYLTELGGAYLNFLGSLPSFIGGNKPLQEVEPLILNDPIDVNRTIEVILLRSNYKKSMYLNVKNTTKIISLVADVMKKEGTFFFPRVEVDGKRRNDLFSPVGNSNLIVIRESINLSPKNAKNKIKDWKHSAISVAEEYKDAVDSFLSSLEKAIGKFKKKKG